MTKCVYNGVYEGNIPVSMIHLHTRGSELILGERPIEFIQQLCKQLFTKGLGLIPTWRPMVFLGRFEENLHFLICYSRLKNKLIEICTKMCTMKYLISCTGMRLIPMWRPMFYFIKHG